MRFTIVYDTYCGWCYGAHPVFSELVKSGAEVTVLHRSLFQGLNAHRMADGFGRMAWGYDMRIGSLTGQQFSERYKTNVLNSKTEVLDSGLTAQAAALVHDRGAEVELALANSLQIARYVDGKPAADRDHVIAALVGNGVDQGTAEAQLGSAELRDKAARLAAQAQFAMDSVRARGVPVLIYDQENRRDTVDISRFYKQPSAILQLAA